MRLLRSQANLQRGPLVSLDSIRIQPATTCSMFAKINIVDVPTKHRQYTREVATLEKTHKTIIISRKESDGFLLMVGRPLLEVPEFCRSGPQSESETSRSNSRKSESVSLSPFPSAFTKACQLSAQSTQSKSNRNQSWIWTGPRRFLQCTYTDPTAAGAWRTCLF